ncbi:MAG: DUF4112 domain-containing protein [Thermoanaerobaculia bacterium]|nr:DUF4112 domain-containing protein [Thermoanaerobaculia bacterium]
MPRERIHIPEVVEPDELLPADLLALRRFARLMDEAVAIPGTKRRVGLDAGIGLIPGVGDVISAVMSAWIIMGALRHRVPMPKIFRMMANVMIDLTLGAIPFIGDIFDFVFAQNVMNMDLLMKHRHRTLPPRSKAEIAAAGTFVIVVLIAFALLVTTGIVAGLFWLVAQRNA